MKNIAWLLFLCLLLSGVVYVSYLGNEQNKSLQGIADDLTEIGKTSKENQAQAIELLESQINEALQFIDSTIDQLMTFRVQLEGMGDEQLSQEKSLYLSELKATQAQTDNAEINAAIDQEYAKVEPMNSSDYKAYTIKRIEALLQQFETRRAALIKLREELAGQ